MQNLIPVLLFVGFAVMIVVVSTVLGRRQALRARANLAALAADLGLEYKELPPVFGFLPRMPDVAGEVGGRRLRFFNYTTGSGKNRRTWRAMGLVCGNQHGLTLQFTTQGFLSGLGVALGMQDVKVGDAAFDDRFVVKTSDPEFIRAALLPEIRSALLAHWAPRVSGASVKLDRQELVYAEMGSFADSGVVARMKALIEPLQGLASLPEVYRS